MFGGNGRNSAQAQIDALNCSQAIIEFNLDGAIITANKNFLEAFGYSLNEVLGRHHSIFVHPSERDSSSYREFWSALGRGEFRSGEFKRLAKGDRTIWIQASYNPITDSAGKPIKVLKVASDVTKAKSDSLDAAGKLAAVSRTQATIEFGLDGTIITANENFLAAVDYSLSDIKGQHHRMFVDPNERDGAAYREFWASLARGEFQSGEYKRIGRGGREIWILASYSPILDDEGKPVKVIKFATDTTEQRLKAADFAEQIAAIGKSQAVIEFNLDGTVITANENFQRALGYSLHEIQGRHHSMFVMSEERGSDDYRAFWRSLNDGHYQAGEYRRVGRGGREVWIQASYNPIFDLNGKPFKIVKYASDVTQQVIARKKSEHVRGLMESVAAGAEELSASVQEISSAMVKSCETASEAVRYVEGADQQAQRLTDAARSMSGIVQMIHEITGQINLLALNATIESARAGEAGRGFAVVATEVKNLANQAKQATDTINNEINSLSAISGDVVGSLNAIRSTIQQVSEYVTSTAAAIEEQSVVTKDMSSSMQHAASEAAALG